MSIRDAFAIGYILGAAFGSNHRKDRDAMDFPEALRRFDRANEKNGIPKGYIDPVFGFVDCSETTNDRKQ